MKKTVLTFGLLCGAILVTTMMVTLPFADDLVNSHSELIGYSSMVLTAVVLFFGVRAYRERVGAGRMSFGRGLVVGVWIALISSLCYVAAFQLVYFKLRPDFGEVFVASTIQHAKDSGATPDEVAAKERQARQIQRLLDRPLTNAALTFLEPLPIGLLASLISAAVLRRKGALPAAAAEN